MTTFKVDNYFLWATVGIILAVVLYLKRRIHRKFTLKESELLSNGFGVEKEKLVKDENGFLKKKLALKKVRGFYDKKKQVFTLTTFNSTINNQNIKEKSPTIEKITGKKVVEAIVKKKWNGYKAIFYLENFKDIIGESDLKEKLPFASFWMGQNGKRENIVIDSKKSPFVFIAGGQGSGKSILIQSQVITYFKSFMDNGSRQPKLVLVSSSKMTEFIPLIERLEKSGEVLVFNANDLNEIRELNSLMNEHLKRCDEFFQALAKEKILARHWHDIEHDLKPLPIQLVFDEAPQYLREENKIKITKESTELEQEAFYLQEEKRRLSLLINKYLETLRETGTTIVIASQYGTQDLMISFTNLKATFLLGRGLTKQVFQVWNMPTEYSEGLGRGLFAYFDGKDYGILKTPLLIKREGK